MPSKADKIILSENLDRRKKLTEEQKEKVKALKNEGFNIAELTREFKVSRFTIMCILDPKFKKQQQELARARQAIYREQERSDPEKRELRNKKRREHKKYKKALYERGLIE